MALGLATACSGDPDTRGGLSKAESDELNAAAATLDAQQEELDKALAEPAGANELQPVS